MSRNLKLAILEITDCPYPQLASYGKNPWIRLSVNKTAIADVQNDGVTIFPGSPTTAHCTVKFKYEEVISVPNAADTKLSIKVMDSANVLARTQIRTKPLLRGVRDEQFIDLEPRGRLHVILTAIDFGKIDKPTVKPIDVLVSMPTEDYLRTDSHSAFSGMTAKKRLRDYKDGEIKRDLPAIAQGTYGIVYKGTVKDHKSQVVAIKDIKVTDPKLFEEWKREVEFMAQHTCPYIIEVFGFAATDAVLTIVMEFAERGTLFDLLHKPKAEDDMTLVKRIRMARHSAMAISFLHSNNVLHRDVKSLNILVTKDWVGKLSDFGAAKLVPKGSNYTKHTQGRGTPLWMAPEVRRGHQYNLSADIFSLGVMLFEIFEVALPLWDTQRETIVLPSYSFLSAPLILPLLHMTPTNRPTAASVAKQIDFILSFILTGRDAHQGSSVVVDLDSLYNIEEAEALKRLKAALQIIKDAKTAPQPSKHAQPLSGRSQSNAADDGKSKETEKDSDKETDGSLKVPGKKPLPKVPDKMNKSQEPRTDRKGSDASSSEVEKPKDVLSPRSDRPPRPLSQPKIDVDKDKEKDKEKEKEKEVKSPRRKSHDKPTREVSQESVEVSPVPKQIPGSLTPAAFAAGPAVVAPPQPQPRLRRSSTPIEALYGSAKHSNDLDGQPVHSKNDPEPASVGPLSKSEYHFIPSREHKDSEEDHRREKDISRGAGMLQPGDLVSPRSSNPPPRPQSGPKARAVMLYDFKPMNPGELEVKAGERLSVLSVVDVWLEGVTLDGRRGWVPTNYIHYVPN